MPSPDRDLPTVNGPSADKTACKWAPGTSELFEGLTDESRVLVGYLVPWDPWVYQQLFNPTTGGLEVRKSRVNSLTTSTEAGFH